MNELQTSPPSFFKVLFLTLSRGIIELLFYIPVLLTMAIYLLPAKVIVWWFAGLLISYTIPHLLIRRGGNLSNVLRVFLDLLLGILPIAWLYPSIAIEYPLIAFISCSFVGVVIVERSIRSLLASWKQSFEQVFMLICLLLFIVLQMLKVFWLNEVAHYDSIYNIAGMLAFVIFLFIANERLIKDQRMVERKSAAIRMSVQQNRVLIALLTIILVSISLFRQFQEAIEGWILSVIRAFIAWLSSLGKEGEPLQQEQGMPPAMDMGLGDAEKEPSIIWHYLEMISKYIVFIALVLLLLFAVYKFGRKAYSVFQQLMAKLFNRHQTVKEEEASYTDEIEALQSVKARSKRTKTTVKGEKRLTDARWQAMSNEKKIRTLYRFVIREEKSRGYRFKSTLTPLETILELSDGQYLKDAKLSNDKEQLQQLLEQYERSRYGQLAPTDAILQSLYSKIVKK